MTRLSSLIILSAAAIALASPALAKISVQGAESLCKSEIAKQKPDAKSVKVDKEATRATGEKFVYLFKVKAADDAALKLACTVDRGTESVTSLAAAD
jgi:hypothetical protein